MPVIDGISAAKQIWEEFGREATKIVAISASTLAHERERYLSEGFDAFVPKPFLAEQIYECLATLLHIEYEEFDADQQSKKDLLDVTIPQELLHRLKEAAEFYRTTQLQELLDELRLLGEDGARLAEHLSSRVRNFDMKAILGILERIEHE